MLGLSWHVGIREGQVGEPSRLVCAGPPIKHRTQSLNSFLIDTFPSLTNQDMRLMIVISRLSSYNYSVTKLTCLVSLLSLFSISGMTFSYELVA
jgi:hypothetical protein